MLSSLLNVFAPMLLGSQLVLLVILLKGEICPGQRGRIHKQLPIIALVWLLLAVLWWPVALVTALIVAFFSQVKIRKTCERGSLWLLYLALAAALAVNLYLLWQATWQQGLFMLCSLVLLGASFSHGLLLLARTRLQAFHRILPITGIVGCMLLCVVILFLGYQADSEQLQVSLLPLLFGFSAMLLAVLLSNWHLFSGQVITKTSPLCALALSVSAVSSFALLLF